MQLLPIVTPLLPNMLTAIDVPTDIVKFLQEPLHPHLEHKVITISHIISEKVQLQDDYLCEHSLC